MSMEAGAHKSIADRLISALQEDEFVLYFQTIISISPQRAERAFQEIFVRFKESEINLRCELLGTKTIAEQIESQPLIKELHRTMDALCPRVRDFRGTATV